VRLLGVRVAGLTSDAPATPSSDTIADPAGGEDSREALLDQLSLRV
jgi:hypothetical protein